MTIKTAAASNPHGILVNAASPGWVATDMGGHRPFSEGTKGTAWAANLPKGGATGGFFRDGVPIDW
ncbi:hypothetical protein [Ruegeria sp. HKCCA6837]|uniref:hypothetical protein n=1 Tax=Ruegeria sp. HKCCA6837 TaxID=2682989 RepID=UPI00352D16CC